MPLPRCVDPPPTPTVDCARMEHEDAVKDLLCPRLLRVQQASCSTLGDATELAALLAPDMPTLYATSLPNRDQSQLKVPNSKLFTGLYMHGIVHEPLDLAQLLVHFASDERLERHRAIRFVSTNSNNGWTACITAVYLLRTHGGGPFHGLAVNGLKTEWATVRNVRVLLEQLSLSWRSETVFDPEADAALMEYYPHVRNSLTPTAFAYATTLLPLAWRGLPPPYDLCFRMGGLDSPEADATAPAGGNASAPLLADVERLASWCRVLAYYDPGGRHSGLADKLLTGARKGHRRAPTTFTRVGPFTVHTTTFGRPSEPFEFVNKTPPARAEMFTPACLRDMAACNGHDVPRYW